MINNATKFQRQKFQLANHSNPICNNITLTQSRTANGRLGAGAAKETQPQISFRYCTPYPALHYLFANRTTDELLI